MYQHGERMSPKRVLDFANRKFTNLPYVEQATGSGMYLKMSNVSSQDTRESHARHVHKIKVPTN